jgi:hypothetical protein
VAKGQTVNLRVPAPKQFACTPPHQPQQHTPGPKPCSSRTRTHTHPLTLASLSLAALTLTAHLALTALPHAPYTLPACVQCACLDGLPDSYTSSPSPSPSPSPDGLPGSYNIIGGTALEFDPSASSTLTLTLPNPYPNLDPNPSPRP